MVRSAAPALSQDAVIVATYPARKTSSANVLRNGSFVLLFGGQCISLTGNAAATIAFPLLLFQQTHSLLQMGLASLPRMLAYLLLSLPAGVWMDRWDRKRAMVFAEVGRIVLLGSIPAAAILGRLTLTQIYIVLAVEAVLFVLFDTALTPSLMAVITPEQSDGAAALISVGANAAPLFGSPLGGMLYAASATLPFLGNAVAYALSAASLLLISQPFQRYRPRQKGQPRRASAGAGRAWEGAPGAPGSLGGAQEGFDDGSPTHLGVRVEIVAGVRWLWHQRRLRWLALLSAGNNLVLASATLALLVIATVQLHALPAAIGVVLSAFAGGSILGSWIGYVALRHARCETVFIVASVLLALVWPVLVVATTIPMLMGVAAAIAMWDQVANVAQYSYRLRVIPDQMAGRVQSVYKLVLWTTQPLGILLLPISFQAIGIHATLLVAAAVLALLALIAIGALRDRDAHRHAPQSRNGVPAVPVMQSARELYPIPPLWTPVLWLSGRAWTTSAWFNHLEQRELLARARTTPLHLSPPLPPASAPLPLPPDRKISSVRSPRSLRAVHGDPYGEEEGSWS